MQKSKGKGKKQLSITICVLYLINYFITSKKTNKCKHLGNEISTNEEWQIPQKSKIPSSISISELSQCQLDLDFSSKSLITYDYFGLKLV